MKSKISVSRVIFLLGCIILSGATFFLSDKNLVKLDIQGDLLSVITILSGVLIAVISILGIVPDKIDYKALVLLDASIQPKIMRLVILLYFYLVALILLLYSKILVLVLTDKSYLYILFKEITLAISFMSILFSFGLPSLISHAFQRKNNSHRQ